MKFWKVNSLGSKRSQTPPGLRKSGMPDSVLTPAPVNTTMRPALGDEVGQPLDFGRHHERRFFFAFEAFLAGRFLAALGLVLGRAGVGRTFGRLARCASFRVPTPPRIRGPLAIALIHAARSAASSG